MRTEKRADTITNAEQAGPWHSNDRRSRWPQLCRCLACMLAFGEDVPGLATSTIIGPLRDQCTEKDRGGGSG